MTVTQITDHTAQALDRLRQQFRGKQNIEDVLTALLTGVQDAESAVYQLLTERSIYTASDATLDLLGGIVGQVRGDSDDTEYRRRILAKIKVNNSRGTIPDIVAIARLVVNDADVTVTLANDGAAEFVVDLFGAAVADDVATILIAFLQQASSAGVRAILRNYSGTYSEGALYGVGEYNNDNYWSSKDRVE